MVCRILLHIPILLLVCAIALPSVHAGDDMPPAAAVGAPAPVGAAPSGAGPAVHPYADLSTPACIQQSGLLDLPAREVTDVGSEQIAALMECALAKNFIFLEILNALILELVDREIRIRVDGEVLRELGATYSFGARRMTAFLSITVLDYLEAGHRLMREDGGEDAALAPMLEVRFTETPEPYSEKVNFIGKTLVCFSPYYGFGTVTENIYGEPFGISVKALRSEAAVKNITIYKPGAIAIYAKGIGRPKRWLISKVARR